MIRHIVFVKFPSDTPADAIDGVFRALDDLRALLPGMLNFKGGANVSPEGLSRGFTHAFLADFADATARDAYLAHPAHQAAGAKLVAVAHGIENLTVVDVEIAG
jgi:hypothetical protein